MAANVFDLVGNIGSAVLGTGANLLSNAMTNRANERMQQQQNAWNLAQWQRNKVFIPFEATGALSSLGAIKEVMTDDKKSKSKKYSANEIFVKVMAGLLALLMVIAAGATLMYCLLH